MYIGVGSGFIGGGIKIFIFVILVGSVWNMVCGCGEFILFECWVMNDNFVWVGVIIMFYMLLVVMVFFVMFVINLKLGFIYLLFEIVSVVVIVGLSMNIIYKFNDVGLFILIVLMYFGCIGLLIFVVVFNLWFICSCWVKYLFEYDILVG